MVDIKKDSFYLNEMAELVKSTEDFCVYGILPEYGAGTVTIFKVIPGLNLGINDFTLNNEVINYIEKYKFFSKPVLKIDYCLKGKMLVCDQKGKMCLTQKGAAAYYAGIENIGKVEHFDKHYESITIFGYVNEIARVIEEIFWIKKSSFLNFCTLLNKETQFTTIKNDAIVIRLVNGIREEFNNGESENARLKTIELLLYEIRNFDKNKRRKDVYFSKSIVNKIISIETYIRDNLDRKITIDKLSNDFDIPLDTLKRCFKQMFSISIYAYIKRARIEKGKELLENSDKSITEIALICGYINHHSFSKAFKEHYKITPREMRKSHYTV